MEGVRKSFEQGVRRASAVGTMVFTVDTKQWAKTHVTFYRLHLAYFVFLSIVGGLVLWAVPQTTNERLPFISAIYTSTAALASTGLQTVIANNFNWFHYSVIMVLSILGSPVLTSLLPLFVRRYYFHQFINQYAHEKVQMQKLEKPVYEKIRLQTLEEHYAVEIRPGIEEMKIDIKSTKSEAAHRHVQGDDDQAECLAQMAYADEMERKEMMFVDAQQALRTLEYRALVTLSWIVVCYMVVVQLMGFLIGIFYFLGRGSRESRILKEKGIQPFFFALFTSITAFSNSGYAMTNDSMTGFIGSGSFLLLYAILAAIGNTLYGPVMRFLVWVCHRLAGEKNKVVYEYLLVHPRRCFTHLFPQYQTLCLVAAFILMTGLQLFFMCLLEWKDALHGLNAMQKVIASFYQAVGSRNAGGAVLSLSGLAPALLLIFIGMMYISAYPVFLSRQTTQEQEHDGWILKDKVLEDSGGSILSRQSARLLMGDTTYIFFAMFVLCFSESESIRNDPLNFSIFNVLFEVTSAYGNIGLSMGYSCSMRLQQDLPCESVPYSFSGVWSIAGRLTIIAIMILGRHRGLPDNVDSAIRLPTKLAPHTLPPTPHPPSSVANYSRFSPWNGDPHQPAPLTHRRSSTFPSVSLMPTLYIQNELASSLTPSESISHFCPSSHVLPSGISSKPSSLSTPTFVISSPSSASSNSRPEETKTSETTTTISFTSPPPSSACRTALEVETPSKEGLASDSLADDGSPRLLPVSIRPQILRGSPLTLEKPGVSPVASSSFSSPSHMTASDLQTPGISSYAEFL